MFACPPMIGRQNRLSSGRCRLNRLKFGLTCKDDSERILVTQRLIERFAKCANDLCSRFRISPHCAIDSFLCKRNAEFTRERRLNPNQISPALFASRFQKGLTQAFALLLNENTSAIMMTNASTPPRTLPKMIQRVLQAEESTLNSTATRFALEDESRCMVIFLHDFWFLFVVARFNGMEERLSLQPEGGGD